MEWTIGRDWQRDADETVDAAMRPGVLKMLGPSEEASGCRHKYTHAVTEALRQLVGTDLGWDSVAAVMKGCALNVLGPPQCYVSMA